MSKKASQNRAWDFRVAQIQLRHPVTHVLLRGHYGNFREDTGECLGTTSQQYGLIQNAVLMQAVRDALTDAGMADFTEDAHAFGDRGQRFSGSFTFANRQLANKVGDIFGYKIVVENSFDRSIRARLSLGLLRLACSNGAATLVKGENATALHTPNVSVAFVGNAIKRLIPRVGEALLTMDSLAGVDLTEAQGVAILAQLVDRADLTDSLAEEIVKYWLNPRREEDKARNLYNLYNAITEYLTHEVAPTRAEYASAVSYKVLVRLNGAAHKLDMLNALLAPVPGDNITPDE